MTKYAVIFLLAKVKESLEAIFFGRFAQRGLIAPGVKT
jgi:hypothetical protein